MANKGNLKPNSERTPKERKELAKKAGKKSGEARRNKKTMKEMLDYLLSKEIENKQGDKASTQEAITIALIKQALNGNVKAFEVIRDTIGEKPTEKHEIKDVTPEIKVATAEDLKALEKLKNADFNESIS